jgi:Na+-translocating ferredoxin:NAD+ oxidoreductase RnfD subunit
VAVYYLFDSAQSWWGALPDAPAPAIVALFATGLFVTDRVNKMPLVVTFLGAWFAFATAGAFVDSPATFAELYRAPDAHAALFFAFFMATDPPTSPPRQRDQVTYGGIAAASAFAVFRWVGAVHFLLSGLLVANLWEAWRRRAQWKSTAAKRAPVAA